MNQTICIIDDQDDSKISFFKTLSNKVYSNLNSVKNLMPNNNILIIFSHNQDFEYIRNKIQESKIKFKNTDIYFLIPKNLNSFFYKTANCIFSPIKINELKNIIRREGLSPAIYSTLELKNNFLTNLENKKSVKVSDIEKEIIKLIFFKKKLKKEIIKVSILKYKSEINSNSVDSHLSRIRNKIDSIKSKISIVSNEKGVISID